MNLSSSVRIVLAVAGVLLAVLASLFGLQYLDLSALESDQIIQNPDTSSGEMLPTQAPIIVLSLFGFSILLLSLLFQDAGWRRGAWAGSLALLLMLYPTFRVYTDSLNPAVVSGIPLDAISWALLSAGIIVLLWAALSRPRNGTGGFLCGFIAGLIPVAGLSVAWTVAGGVHRVYLRLLSLPYPRLADCMTALMDSLTFTIVVLVCFMAVPVLLGLVSLFRSRFVVADGPARIFPEIGWPAVLADMSLFVNMTMLVVRPSLTSTLNSWVQFAETVGYVPLFAPAQAILFFSLLPFLVFNGIIWAIFVAVPQWRSGENRLSAMLTGFIILVAAAMSWFLPSGMLAHEILLMLMGIVLLLLAQFGCSGHKKLSGASADGIASRLIIAGNIVASAMMPMVAGSLVVGLGYITLIGYCSAGAGGMTFTELRRMSRIETVWVLTASIQVVICSAMMIFYAFNTAAKSVLSRLFRVNQAVE